MAFNNEEILTLAKAGFTAQQIAALATIGTPAQSDQAAAPVPQTVEQPATVPAVPEVTAPEPAPLLLQKLIHQRMSSWLQLPV